jgi:hypothetical protein
MASSGERRIYDALALPNEALRDGGAEILRVGIVNNELYVTARRAFKEPARWGEVLADIARELALFQSAEDTGLTEAEILTEIEQAFAADLGAPPVEDDEPAPPPAKTVAPGKPAAKAKPKMASATGKSAAKAKSKSAAKATKRKKR